MFRVKNDNCVTWDRISSCVTRETNGVFCVIRGTSEELWYVETCDADLLN